MVDTEGDEPWLEQQRSAIQERMRANISSVDNPRLSFRAVIHVLFTTVKKLSRVFLYGICCIFVTFTRMSVLLSTQTFW